VRHISFKPRFINAAGIDLLPDKIHTIRQNFDYWKSYEGLEVALFTWEGVPYKSKHHIFCTKKLYHVQKVTKSEVADFWKSLDDKNPIPIKTIAINDGFKNHCEFIDWFVEYPFGEYVILHFTDFRY